MLHRYDRKLVSSPELGVALARNCKIKKGFKISIKDFFHFTWQMSWLPSGIAILSKSNNDTRITGKKSWSKKAIGCLKTTRINALMRDNDCLVSTFSLISSVS